MLKFILVLSSISFGQEKPIDVQNVMVKSGITIDECQFLKENLKLSSDACDQLAGNYLPIYLRAENLVKKISIINPEKAKTISTHKIANLLKEFPKISDEEVLKEFVPKDLAKK